MFGLESSLCSWTCWPGDRTWQVLLEESHITHAERLHCSILQRVLVLYLCYSFVRRDYVGTSPHCIASHTMQRFEQATHSCHTDFLLKLGHWKRKSGEDTDWDQVQWSKSSLGENAVATSLTSQEEKDWSSGGNSSMRSFPLLVLIKLIWSRAWWVALFPEQP